MVCMLSRGRGHDRSCSRLFLFGFILLVVSILNVGCFGPVVSDNKLSIDSRVYYIQGVPFFRQSESTCGPAALASVLSFWGGHVDLDRITAKIYLPALKGTLMVDMENYARDEGYAASSIMGTLEDVKMQVRKGNPVICLLDLGFWVYRQPHYITVIGFNDDKSFIICHDGAKPDTLMTYDSFEASWKRAGNWMLQIRPQGKKEGA